MAVFWQTKSACVALLGLGAAGAACAADLTMQANGLHNGNGTAYAAACTEDQLLDPTCTWFGRGPTSTGVVTVTGVPPATYAVHVIHDQNDNRALDRPGFLPTKGMGFSRDAPMRSGPPRWDDVTFDLAEPGATVPLTMRYFE